MAETGSVTYGIEKSGKWRTIPEAEWEERIVEPNKVYEFNYMVPEVSWWAWWPWIQVFDPVRYVSELREELARGMAVTPEEIQIPWFYYNPDTRKFRVQVQYVPVGPHGEVGFAVVTILYLSFLILSITGLIAMFGALWDKTPVLEMVKDMKEGAVEVGTVMKYVVYGIIAIGSIYLAARVIPKRGKKKVKVEPQVQLVTRPPAEPRFEVRFKPLPPG